MLANFSSQCLEFGKHFVNVSKFLIFYWSSWQNIACKLFSAATSWGGKTKSRKYQGWVTNMTYIWVTASHQISLYIHAVQTVQESPERHAKNMSFRSHSQKFWFSRPETGSGIRISGKASLCTWMCFHMWISRALAIRLLSWHSSPKALFSILVEHQNRLGSFQKSQ